MTESNYLKILNRQHCLQEDTENSLAELRWTVLHSPCPSELRGWIWKILLRLCDSVSASCYIKLVERGPSPMDTKIRNDTFRTMTTDASFIEHVSEDMLIRVLNAFVWISQQDSRAQDTSEELQLRTSLEQKATAELTYVQGMNVLAAPFLMVLPEMEAFFAFSKFLWQWCPLYVHPNLKGVHCGLKLVDMCLRALDPELYGYLLGKGLTANMYAFPSVLTFSACTPPLAEVLRLWDIMFAFGFHLNILFIVAQLQLAREDIINCPSPMKILRKLPPLKAHAIIELAVTSCKELPPKLYENLVRHLYDERVAEDLGVQVTGISTTTPSVSQHQSNRYYRR
ncbi:rab-GTPase-TBC domain-containing protein [Circinella umbellata]|nr:rab-GTPase-TBC domain-containing protein [Circinella umbellata]